VGGQVILTNEVDNYPAVPHVDGYTLAEAMRTQAEELGGSIVMESALSITTDPETGTFHVTSSDVESTCHGLLILAGGATPRRAGFDGEERFAGHGVSYCATCDGMFYRGKRVYVVGGGNSACEEALFLTRFASEVILVVRKDHVRAQASVARQLDENPKIKIEFETTLVAVGGGESSLSWVSLRDERTGQVHTEKYDEGSFGVFVFVGRMPRLSLVAGMVDLDETGHVVNRRAYGHAGAGSLCRWRRSEQGPETDRHSSLRRSHCGDERGSLSRSTGRGLGQLFQGLHNPW